MTSVTFGKNFMNKRLFLVSALFAGAMIIDTGFCSNFKQDSVEGNYDPACENVNERTDMNDKKHDLTSSDSNRSDYVESLFNDIRSLNNITIDELQYFEENYLIWAADKIKYDFGSIDMTNDKRKSILDTAFNILKSSTDWKFDTAPNLLCFVGVFYTYPGWLNLITPERISGINYINELIEIASCIKDINEVGDIYIVKDIHDNSDFFAEHNPPVPTREITFILNTIAIVLRNNPYWTFYNWSSVRTFIKTFCNCERGFDSITHARFANLSYTELLKTKKLVLNFMEKNINPSKRVKLNGILAIINFIARLKKAKMSR